MYLKKQRGTNDLYISESHLCSADLKTSISADTTMREYLSATFQSEIELLRGRFPCDLTQFLSRVCSLIQNRPNSAAPQQLPGFLTRTFAPAAYAPIGFRLAAE